MLIGIHCLKKSPLTGVERKTLNIALEEDKQYGLTAMQIFTHGPRGFYKCKFDIEKIKKIKLEISVHCTYPSIGIWQVNSKNKNEPKMKKILDHLVDQLTMCKQVNAKYFVLHISKNIKKTPITHTVIIDAMKTLKKFAIKNKVKILLEMVSSKADEHTYETPEKINALNELMESYFSSDWWGWCIDTAHIHGAGVDIKSYVNMAEWLDKIKYKNRIYQFHLNGTSSLRGSGSDKHEIPFSATDVLWGNVQYVDSGFRAVIEFVKKNKQTIIYEIKRGNEADFIKLLKYI